jgi:hypothetical protein
LERSGRGSRDCRVRSVVWSLTPDVGAHGSQSVDGRQQGEGQGRRGPGRSSPGWRGSRLKLPQLAAVLVGAPPVGGGPVCSFHSWRLSWPELPRLAGVQDVVSTVGGCPGVSFLSWRLSGREIPRLAGVRSEAFAGGWRRLGRGVLRSPPGVRGLAAVAVWRAPGVLDMAWAQC